MQPRWETRGATQAAEFAWIHWFILARRTL